MSLISLSLAVIFNIILPTFKNSQRWRQLRCCNGCSMERRSYPWWFCSWTAEWVHPPTFAGRQCSWISSGLWIDKAHTLDEARKNCEVYRLSADSNSFHLSDFGALCSPGEENSAPTQCLPMETKCCFWSKQRHPRFKCPAQEPRSTQPPVAPAVSRLQYGRRRNANALREGGHIELIEPILTIITVEK